MILLADSEGLDQTAQMRRLIWAVDVHLYPKTRFRMMRVAQMKGKKQVEKEASSRKILKGRANLNESPATQVQHLLSAWQSVVSWLFYSFVVMSPGNWQNFNPASLT